MLNSDFMQHPRELKILNNNQVKKIRISVVSYLNSLPFVYGLEHSNIQSDIQLSKDIPSSCAQKLLTNEVDLGLVPVAILPKLKNYELVSDYCIGAHRDVRTVILTGNTAVENMTTILQDSHSRTSVALAKVLAKHYWHITPQWEAGGVDFEQQLKKEDTGGVVIGDKVFAIEHAYKYRYDLAEMWYQLTGLPFVFAAWVSNKALPETFIQRFNESLQWGINHISDMLATYPDEYAQKIDLAEYLQKSIQYQFDDQKKVALNQFLDYLKTLD